MTWKRHVVSGRGKCKGNFQDFCTTTSQIVETADIHVTSFNLPRLKNQPLHQVNARLEFKRSAKNGLKLCKDLCFYMSF